MKTLFFLLVVLCSCSSGVDQTQLLSEYLHNRFNHEIPRGEYNYLIIPLRRGCVSCSEMFINKLDKLGTPSKTQVIVSSLYPVSNYYPVKHLSCWRDEDEEIERLALKVFTVTLICTQNGKVSDIYPFSIDKKKIFLDKLGWRSFDFEWKEKININPSCSPED